MQAGRFSAALKPLSPKERHGKGHPHLCPHRGAHGSPATQRAGHAEEAAACSEAYSAGASVMHLHPRRQEPGMGRFLLGSCGRSRIVQAVREAHPDAPINMSTGVMGPDAPGPLACMSREA